MYLLYIYTRTHHIYICVHNVTIIALGPHHADTPPNETNVEPKNWWFGDVSVFSGSMLVFGGVHDVFFPHGRFPPLKRRSLSRSFRLCRRSCPSYPCCLLHWCRASWGTQVAALKDRGDRGETNGGCFGAYIAEDRSFPFFRFIDFV